MTNPFASGWREAKILFQFYLTEFRKQTGWDIQFIAKQHITWDKKSQSDDVHYDLILYHNVPRSEQWVRRKILGFWHRACMMNQKTTHSSLVDFDVKEVHAVCNYTFKYAPRGEFYDVFMRHHFLPHSKLAVTWQSSGFFRRKPLEVTLECIWNGEFQEREATLSPFHQCWKEYLETFIGDGIPEFTTEEYRRQLIIEFRLSDLIDSLDCEEIENKPLPIETSIQEHHQHQTSKQQQNRIKHAGNQEIMPENQKSKIYQSCKEIDQSCKWKGIITQLQNAELREECPENWSDDLFSMFLEITHRVKPCYLVRPVVRNKKCTGKYRVAILPDDVNKTGKDLNWLRSRTGNPAQFKLWDLPEVIDAIHQGSIKAPAPAITTTIDKQNNPMNGLGC